jgi:hypothetical protein
LIVLGVQVTLAELQPLVSYPLVDVAGAPYGPFGHVVVVVVYFVPVNPVPHATGGLFVLLAVQVTATGVQPLVLYALVVVVGLP